MSYFLILGTIVLALFSLQKDWTNYKHPWRRRTVFCLIVLVGVAQVRKTSLDKEQNDSEQRAARKNIETLKNEVASLQGQAQAANAAQAQNTIQFMQQFTRLSDKVRELQTDITTADLRKQLVSVQSDLQKTRRAMAPGPKATLTFSFVPFFNPPSNSNEPIKATTETTLPVDTEDIVQVEYTVLNLTEVPALEGELTLYICNTCTYAKEPEGYRKLPGTKDTERYIQFDRLLPHVRSATPSLSIRIPKGINTFAVGFSYRCRTCVLESVPSNGIVHVTRPFVRPMINLPNKQPKPTNKNL